MGSRSDAKRRWAVLSDAIRTRLWPLPTAAVVVAVASGIGLTRLDSGVDGQLPAAVTAYLFGGDADAARSVLSAVAGSLITVTSLTFSLTVVTLQLASSQFSPRLLRTFSGDRFVQGTLALFTAHLVREIRVETMVRNVHTLARATLLRVLPELDGDPPAVGVPVPAAGVVPITARTSGFLTKIDEQRLLAAAVDAGAVVLVDRCPGSSRVARTPFGFCWPLDPVDQLGADVLARLQDGVAGAVSTGFERTAVQDIGYGLRQLTDVATKALSPGINDPTTAVHTLGYSAALLGEMAQRDLGPAVLRDAQQQDFDGAERAEMATLGSHVQAALDRRWPPR